MHTDKPTIRVNRTFSGHSYRNFWHSLDYQGPAGANSGMTTALQIAAILVAVAAFAALLAGDWRFALGAVAVFAGLAWAWKRRRA